jgi:hypothetical protein
MVLHLVLHRGVLKRVAVVRKSDYTQLGVVRSRSSHALSIISWTDLLLITSK